MRRGLSFVEVLITLGLLALGLGLLGAVTAQYARLLQWQDQSSQGAYKVGLANQVGDEVSQALNFSLPVGQTVGDSSANPLQFTKIDPNVVPRPDPSNDARRPRIPGGMLAMWDPAQSRYLSTVKYWFDAGQLVRQIALASGTTQTSVLAEGMGGFQVQRVASDQVVVRISYMEGETLRVARSCVYMWPQ